MDVGYSTAGTRASAAMAARESGGARGRYGAKAASYAMHDEIIQVGVHIAAMAAADNAATVMAMPARKWRWAMASPCRVGMRAVSRQLRHATMAVAVVAARKSACDACTGAML